MKVKGKVKRGFFMVNIALLIIIKFLLHFIIVKRKGVTYIIGKEQN